MNTIFWAGYHWKTTERNGLQFHPAKPNFWLDSKEVTIDTNGYLHLTSRYNPKKFGSFDRPMACGLISSVNEFEYGTFEIYAKLPSGKYLWPAFWAYSCLTWPPEVDMFEGYSNGDGSYWNFQWLHWFSPWNIRTNCFYGKSTKPKEIGSKQHSETNGDPSKRFEYYRLEWKPKTIRIFYGTKMVRCIDDSDIINQFNKSKMNIIINNGITNDAKSCNKMKESDFVIKYFSYKPL